MASKRQSPCQIPCIEKLEIPEWPLSPIQNFEWKFIIRAQSLVNQ